MATGELYLEVVEIVHDLIVVHVKVVEAKRLNCGFPRFPVGGRPARVHRVAHNGGAFHFGRAATWRDQMVGMLTVKSISVN